MRVRKREIDAQCAISVFCDRRRSRDFFVCANARARDRFSGACYASHSATATRRPRQSRLRYALYMAARAHIVYTERVRSDAVLRECERDLRAKYPLRQFPSPCGRFEMAMRAATNAAGQMSLFTGRTPLAGCGAIVN